MSSPPPRPRLPPPPAPTPPVRVISPWVAGADGSLTRTLVTLGDAADDTDKLAEAPVSIMKSPNDFAAHRRLPEAYRQMTVAIERCQRLADVMVIRTQAAELAVWARIAKDVDAEKSVARLRLRAERRVGQISLALSTRKGRHRTKKHEMETKLRQLSDAGITRQAAYRFEQLAKITDADFANSLANARSLSTRGVILHAAAARRGTDIKINSRARGLWRRLLTFRDDLLRHDLDPVELLSAMPPPMRATVCDLAPAVAHWLSRLAPAPHERNRRTAAVDDHLEAPR